MSVPIFHLLLDHGSIPADADTASGDFMAWCPAHETPGVSNPSLHYTLKADGFEALHCFAGCEQRAVLDAIGYSTNGSGPAHAYADFYGVSDELDEILSGAVAAAAELTPREEYAKLKGLDLDLLAASGVLDQEEGGATGFGYVYLDADGNAVMARTRASASEPVKSARGKRHMLYGLDRISGYLADGVKRVHVCEGETDTLTLWQAGYPALGIIGVNGYKPSRDDQYLSLFEEIVVVPDSDEAGGRMATKFVTGPLGDRVKVVLLPAEVKDVNVLYLLDRGRFKTSFDDLVERAVQGTAVMSPFRFFDLSGRNPVFRPKFLADALASETTFAVGQDGGLLRYHEGVWLDDGDQYIESTATRWLEDRFEPDYVNKAVKFFKMAGSFERVSFSPPHEERVVVHCASGIVDVLKAARLDREYEPEPSTPKRAWLAGVPWEYSPDAACPGITEFLRQVLPGGDDGLDYFMEVVGYGMQFRQTLRQAALFYGSGNNGKSLAARSIVRLYGDENVSTMSLARLTGDRFAVARLVGKLANVCADIGPTLPKDVSEFKAVTGGDAVHGERKYRDPFSFSSGAFPIFSCNSWPRTPDSTASFFNRWQVIEFPHEFPEDAEEEARIKALFEDEDEMRGYFRLAVEGLARLTERSKFEVPPSSVEAKSKFIAANTSVPFD